MDLSAEPTLKFTLKLWMLQKGFLVYLQLLITWMAANAEHIKKGNRRSVQLAVAEQSYYSIVWNPSSKK